MLYASNNFLPSPLPSFLLSPHSYPPYLLPSSPLLPLLLLLITLPPLLLPPSPPPLLPSHSRSLPSSPLICSIFLTANRVSCASWARVTEVTRACCDRYGGGRGLPVTASPLCTDSPFPCRW